ncbi:MAG: O-antigen ligase family protein [Ignavibacteriae bacterium]|nr:O-antigen ligase family protein [Ignavibacteriota bacterium]
MTLQLSQTHERFVKQALFGFLLITVVGLTFSIAVSSIAMGIAIAFYVALIMLSKNGIYEPTTFDYFFLAYAIAELLSTVFSVDPSASIVNMKRLLLISIVYLTVLSIDTRQKYAWAILLLIVVTALLSIIESLLLEKIGDHLTRLGMFQHYMTAGGIKMIVVLMILPFIVQQQTPTRWRIAAALCLLPMLIALVLTQTRSSWLGFLAGASTIGIIKNKKFLLVLAGIIIFFFLLAPATFTERATSIFDPTLRSNLTRINMITTGWQMFLDFPVFGVGDIDLKKLYVTYTEPIDPAEGGHLHNNAMTLLVTLGVVGFIAVMALFVKIFLIERNIVQRVSNDWLYGSTSLGCFAAYIGFHVNGLFEWNFGDHEIAVLLWFTVGLSLVSQRLIGEKTAENT